MISEASIHEPTAEIILQPRGTTTASPWATPQSREGRGRKEDGDEDESSVEAKALEDPFVEVDATDEKGRGKGRMI
jgi:hypothetical protein